MSKAPFWYDTALQVPRDTAQVTVAGATIEYATWGKVGNPGIVLIHGSNAHLEWWRFTAPFSADRFRVAALDLSGNGNSDWRERYSGELFAKKFGRSAQPRNLVPRPFVVGHSFGGFCRLRRPGIIMVINLAGAVYGFHRGTARAIYRVGFARRTRGCRTGPQIARLCR
ncbi:MAG: hypothetical protein CM15mP120_02680 [Pseudomonadota bacterium]|nr:MAG: hypothetical protein CM15mP120_02680 [Pseudomonadota bacterium]